MKRGTSTSHRTTTENKDAAANVTAKSIWFKRQLNMAVAAVVSVALCATMAFVAALTGYVSSSDLDSAAYKMAASQAEITESLITDSDGVRKVYNSAAIAFPDGHTDSYQKMHRAGSEETAWSLPGSTPVMFEMPEWTGSDGKPLKVAHTSAGGAVGTASHSRPVSTFVETATSIRNSVVIMPRPEPNCSCIRRPRPATHGIANPAWAAIPTVTVSQ